MTDCRSFITCNSQGLEPVRTELERRGHFPPEPVIIGYIGLVALCGDTSSFTNWSQRDLMSVGHYIDTYWDLWSWHLEHKCLFRFRDFMTPRSKKTKGVTKEADTGRCKAMSQLIMSVWSTTFGHADQSLRHHDIFCVAQFFLAYSNLSLYWKCYLVPLPLKPKVPSLPLA